MAFPLEPPTTSSPSVELLMDVTSLGFSPAIRHCLADEPAVA